MKVKVAVIDSGIELYHEAFKNSHVSGTRIIKRGCCLEKNEDIYDTKITMHKEVFYGIYS